MPATVDLPIIDYRDVLASPSDFIDGVVAGIEGRPGILQIANPPVDWGTWEVAQRLIYQLLGRPAAELVSMMRPDLHFQRGWSPFGAETARGCFAPDIKSFWMYREETPPQDPADQPYGPNLWPDLQGFRAALTDVMAGQMELYMTLLWAVEEHYELGERFLRDRALGAENIQRPILYQHPDVYRAQAAELLADHRELLSPQLVEIYEHVLEHGMDACVPSAQHLDICIFTILLTAAGSHGGGGLQGLIDGDWVGAGTRKGVAVVNIGEMLPKVHPSLAHLTCTRHRVTRYDSDGRAWPKDWWRAIAPLFGHFRHSTQMASGERYDVAFLRRIRQLVGEEEEEAESVDIPA